MSAIELVSGLALDRGSSFARQLALLKRALEERGYPARVTAAPSTAHTEGSSSGAPEGNQERILLGYPDQFLSLDPDHARGAGRRRRTFLWCQASRPPRAGEVAFFRRVEPVALTPRTRNYLESALGDSRPIPVIPHGVDTDLFKPGPPPSLGGELGGAAKMPEGFVVGAVGANTYRKRFDRIFESFAHFCQMLDDQTDRAFLVVKTDRIVGLDGRDLQRLAARFGIADRTRLFEGEWDAPRMAGLYRHFDVFVNLSEWEGFGIPVIEAMASGVPVLTHEVQGPGEILPYDDFVSRAGACSTEEGALLVDADPADVARLLSLAYRNPALRRLRSREGRSAAIERYDIRTVAACWIDLIERDYPISPPA